MTSTSIDPQLFEFTEWAVEISQERQRIHDIETEKRRRAEQARIQVQERINTGQHDPITATREAYDVGLALRQFGYMQKGSKWLSPNSSSKTPGVTVKDGKWFSHHDSDSMIGQPAQSGGTWGDSFDLIVHYQYGGNFDAAVKALGEQYTIQDPVKGDVVTINKFNQRQHMRQREQTTADPQQFVDGGQTVQLDGQRPQEQMKVNVITLGELRHKNPQIEPLIDGFLNKHGGLVIHAQGGLGKSMLSLNIAIMAAMAREPLFGTFDIPRRLTSLFIQTENSAATVNSRVRSMVGENPEHIAALDLITMPFISDDVVATGRPFSDSKFSPWLKMVSDASAQKTGQPVDIIFVDPLISFCPGDENDASKMRHELDCLSGVCREIGATPVLIHHDNRNGDYRGSSAIYDWCRGMIGLKREMIGSDRATGENKHRTAAVPCIQPTHEKANDMAKFKPFVLRMGGDLNFQRLDTSISAEQMEQGRLIQQALTDLGGYAESQNDLITVYMELSGASRGTARTHITTAVKNDFVVMESTLKNGKHAYKFVLNNRS